MEAPPRISQLRAATVSRLRSSYILRGLAQCVEELVCNSLDAGASSVNVSVDVVGLTISVEDDGSGISPVDMKAIGQRYSTSKLFSLQELESGPTTLGFRGEALASLAGAFSSGIIVQLFAHCLCSLNLGCSALIQTCLSSRSHRDPQASSTRTTR